MILDEHYDEIKELKIDEQNREQFTVNPKRWDKTLARYERLHGLGCITVAIWLFILVTFLLDSYFRGFLLLLFSLGFAYKLNNNRRGTNLRMHAQYEYELGHDRLVRYGVTHYRIFLFSELEMVQNKSFGLLLWKERPTLINRLFHRWHHENERLIIIPNDLQSYEQVKAFILKTTKATA